MARIDRIVARRRMAARPRRVIKHHGVRVLGWPFHCSGDYWWKVLRHLSPADQARERAARKELRRVRYADVATPVRP